MVLEPFEIAILLKPLFTWVFLGLVVYPLMWVLYQLIPDGIFKVTLFKVRDGPEATRHDRVVKLWAAIAGNAMLWGWIAVLSSIGP